MVPAAGIPASAVVLVFLLFLSGADIFSQHFTAFISYVNRLPKEMQQAKADSFLFVNPALPFHDNDTTIVFVAQSTAKNGQIAGDFTNWKPSVPMTRLASTDLLYCIKNFEPDARIDYKLVLDDKWMTDPKNPLSCTGGYGTNSELRMPGYIQPPEVSFDPAIPHGTIKDTVFASGLLKNKRNIKIYLPAGYNLVKQEYPLVLFHDGIDFVNLGAAANILDRLIVYRQMVPVIAVFIPGVDREEEYAGKQKDAYCSFICDELLPYIDSHYATVRDPHKRATIGISNGGNIAIYLGMKHPSQFGRIGAMSSNFEPVIQSEFQSGPRLDLEFYLDIGTYDMPELVTLTTAFLGILASRNYGYQQHTWHEGHSWCNWAAHLSFPLKQFFPYPH